MVIKKRLLKLLNTVEGYKLIGLYAPLFCGILLIRTINFVLFPITFILVFYSYGQTLQYQLIIQGQITLATYYVLHCSEWTVYYSMVEMQVADGVHFTLQYYR